MRQLRRTFFVPQLLSWLAQVLGDAGAPLSIEQLGGVHDRVDENGDGRISLEELLGFHGRQRRLVAVGDVKAVLEELDANGDRHLNLEEVLAGMRPSTEEDEEAGEQVVLTPEERQHFEALEELEAVKFAAVDADADGRLDLEELASLYYPETHNGVLKIDSEVLLRQLDQDEDGAVSRQEWTHHGEQTEEAQVEDFDALDRDGSGSLSLDELMVWESGQLRTEAAMRELLDLADEDRDGHVTKRELHEAREQLSGRPVEEHFGEWARHYDL